ncbi:MAG: peptidylprolyl isomerase [Planctomycetota bacterium]|nr:peptidylprolyl isomerase [Planctomycetota bacterium]
MGKVCGPDHLLVLETFLHNEAPVIRGRAAIAIALLYRRVKDKKPKAHEAALTGLLKALNFEKKHEVRWRLIYALGTMVKHSVKHQGLAGTFSKLVSAKEDSRTQAFAARALASLYREQSKQKLKVAPLAPTLLSKREWPWTVAVEVIRALSAAPTVDSTKQLCALTKHESFHVRRAAAKALIKAKSPGTGDIEALIELSLRSLLNDAWETVRGEALVALTALKKGEMHGTIKEFIADGVTARRYAAKALAQLEKLSAEDRKLVEALNKDSDHRVRLDVIESFGKKEGFFGLVLEALDDKKISVAGTAVGVLAERKENGISEALATRYRKDKNNTSRYEIREMICDVLGQRGLGKPKGVEDKLLRDALNDPRQSVRVKAAAALEKILKMKVRFESAPPIKNSRPKQKPVKGRVTVRFQTSRGSFEVELFADIAPLHVANLLHLIRVNQAKSSKNPNKPFYDGLTWHRVVSHFVVQGGCPNGDGWGDPGWTLPDELSDLNFGRGVLGMPKAGDDTGGCQLFFCHNPTPHLDGRYTIFGVIKKGLSVLDLLEEGDAITKVDILESEK